MPLTEEQKARLRANLNNPFGNSDAPAQQPSQLLPSIQRITSGIPQGQPYIKSLGKTPVIAFPPPQQEIQRQMAVTQAKQQMKSSIPSYSDTMKRDFARIDAFEGLLNDMQKMVGGVRKGPVQGRYVETASKLSGGSEVGKKGFANQLIPDVSQKESINAVNYSQVRPAIARGLYRAVTGDDRLSDKDAELAALPFVPDLKLSTEAFNQRMDFIKRAINRRRDSIKKSAQLGGSQALDPTAFTSFMVNSLMGDEE